MMKLILTPLLLVQLELGGSSIQPHSKLVSEVMHLRVHQRPRSGGNTGLTQLRFSKFNKVGVTEEEGRT